MKNIFYLILTLSIFSCQNNIETNFERDINSSWVFKTNDSEDIKWYKADVPGNIHTDLLNNKLIEDPFYGTQENELQWIEKEDWVYITKFKVDDKELSYQNIDLEFLGIDTYSDVFLNGEKILSTDNMYLNYSVNIKSLLKEYNELKVILHSPIKMAMPLFEKAGITYPADNDRSKEHLSVFTRKAPYHYGWDWGPRYVTSGIWRPVKLRFWNNQKITDLYLENESISHAKADLQVNYSIFSKSKENVQVQINIDDKTLLSENVNLEIGENHLSKKIIIENPELWWPNGLGSQKLYNVELTIDNGSKTIDSKIVKHGIRQIEFINEKDSLGVNFYFKVNGKKIFSKGANYIPNDVFLGRVSKEKYQTIFEDAVKSNFNMLRVWGGGIYEDDEFYNLADEKGILIWQDFMFSCTMYPGDKEFLDNVKKEAIYNIKRLRKHSSLAFWCGNNEVQVGWDNWGWQNTYKWDEKTQAKLISDYDKLFKKLLQELVDSLDYRSYIHSSPISNWGDLKDMNIADNHYWGVWWGKHRFDKFNIYVPRFMSEYGFQSFPEIKTIKTFADKDQWNIDSPVMNLRQKSSIGNATIDQYMNTYYKTPDNFEDFVYVNQVLQAYGMDIAFRSHRRNKPFNMGTLYWQFNDVWPAISWSGIDYYGRWKAMQYYVAKAFYPVITSSIIEGNKLSVYAISDLPNIENFDVQIQFITLDGKVISEKKINIDLDDTKAFKVLDFNMKNLFSKHGKNNLIALISIQNENYKSEEIKEFELPKNINLKKPKIEFNFKKFDQEIEIEMSTNNYTKNIELKSDIDGSWSDNFFNLIPGKKYKVQFKCKATLEEFKKSFDYQSLIDTY